MKKCYEQIYCKYLNCAKCKIRLLCCGLDGPLKPLKDRKEVDLTVGEVFNALVQIYSRTPYFDKKMFKRLYSDILRPAPDYFEKMCKWKCSSLLSLFIAFYFYLLSLYFLLAFLTIQIERNLLWIITNFAMKNLKKNWKNFKSNMIKFALKEMNLNQNWKN